MLRAIREIQPSWIVGENVSGLISWNGGLVFHEVQTDLEAAGYKVLPFILPACAVNAPHRRDRVWFIAYSDSCRNNSTSRGTNGFREQQDKEQSGSGGAMQTNRLGDEQDAANSNGYGCDRSDSQNEKHTSYGRFDALNDIEQVCDATDTSGIRLEGSVSSGEYERQRQQVQEGGKVGEHIYENKSGIRFQNFPTQSPVCFRNDGIPSDTHARTIQNENSMDRSIVIKNCLDKGYLFVNYETGQIYSTRSRNRMEKGMAIELPGAICNGYKVHNIYFEGIKKQCRAHQIVWISANGLYDKDKYMIDHIDRDKENNRLSNLRLVDAKGNRSNVTEYEGKLSQDEKDRMFALYEDGNMSMRELGEDFGISKSRVQQLISEHCKLDGITFPKWRNESIKAAGNAIVPQVALEIFKVIQKMRKP